MNSQEYWIKRSLAHEKRARDKGEKFIFVLQKEYEAARKSIDEDIKKFTARYAAANKISIAQAHKKLGQFEQAEYTQNIEKQLKEVGKFDVRLEKQLSNKYLGQKVSRLQAIKNQVELQLKALGMSQDYETFKHLSETFKSTYYHNIFDLGRSGVINSFNVINTNLVENIVSTPWNSKNYSERIWTHNKKLQREIRSILSNAAATKTINVDTMSRKLADRMSVSLSNARRLVRTETNFVLNQASLEAYKKAGLTKYQFTAVLDLKTSKICQSLDNRVFDIDAARPGVNYPPMHPNCRSTTVPYFEEDADDKPGVKFARDKDGKGIYIPENMNYAAWHSKYIKPYEDVQLTDKMQKAVTEYISSASYIINEKLRTKEELTKKDKRLIRNFDRALSVMPNYIGEVTRSLFFFSKEDLFEFLSQHTKGSLITYKAYTSATIGTRYNDGSQVELYIKSLAGKDLTKYNKGEAEIVFKRNSSFIVEDISYKEDCIIIYMREVSDGKNKG